MNFLRDVWEYWLLCRLQRQCRKYRRQHRPRCALCNKLAHEGPCWMRKYAMTAKQLAKELTEEK